MTKSSDRQRTDDDKAIQKLFKDINNGGLRRKRNSEFDLSDSDDDAEARRRRKQREFAKMRKALLENENVGKIAEDPKKTAFLKAIEDRDFDEDFDFLGLPAEDTFRVEMDTQEDSNSQSQQSPSDVETSNRALQESAPSTANMRPPASKQRTQAPRKPTSLAEIKESVSFLVEDPGSYNNRKSSPSSDEDDVSHISDSQRSEEPSRTSFTNPRRTSAIPIIDRLTLKRQSSSSLSAVPDGEAMAFHAPSNTNTFVPSLLRRATISSVGSMNNSLDSSGGSGHATTERAAGGGEKDFVKRGGPKTRMSVNFSVREQEKKGLLDGVEKRRREKREKLARERGRMGGIGKLSRMSTWDG